MARLQKVYKDIDINFNAHPVTGDLVRVFDEAAIKQAIKTLIFTNFYERPFHPFLGSDVKGYLFEPATPITADALKRDIRDVIEKYEPRAQIRAIEVIYREERNAFNVALEFKIIGLDNPVQIDFLLNRAR